MLTRGRGNASTWPQSAAVVERFGPFDHHHAIGAGRNRSAGHDLGCIARAQRDRRHRAGKHLFDDAHLGAPFFQVGGAQRVAIDQRLVVRRHIDVADNVLSQPQPQGCNYA